MDSNMLEEILLPWWKILSYMAALIATAVAIKVVIKFDVNLWFKDLREGRRRRDSVKRAEQCGHVWTLYPQCVYLQCNMCLAFIFTSTLLFAMTHFDIKPLIVGKANDIMITPGERDIIATDYIGNRKT